MSKRNGLIGALLVASLGIMALMLPGIAAAKDRNHDRIPDRWEKHHGLSLNVNEAKRNQDHDGLNNRQEFKAGDDPLDADSNNDGIDDGQDGAGTITSFDGTTLTINLFDGTTLSGQVTDQTEIQCDNGDAQGDEDGDNQGGGDKAAASSTPSDDGSGDDDGSDQSGNNGDNGDDDQGDDGQMCSTADLVPGAVVQEAQLGDTGTVFDQIDVMTGNNDLVDD